MALSRDLIQVKSEILNIHIFILHICGSDLPEKMYFFLNLKPFLDNIRSYILLCPLEGIKHISNLAVETLRRSENK